MRRTSWQPSYRTSLMQLRDRWIAECVIYIRISMYFHMCSIHTEYYFISIQQSLFFFLYHSHVFFLFIVRYPSFSLSLPLYLNVFLPVYLPLFLVFSPFPIFIRSFLNLRRHILLEITKTKELSNE